MIRFSDLSLRSVNESDYPFLVDVYRSTRENELALSSFTEIQQQPFIQAQFLAQNHHYQTHYPNAVFSLILYADEPVGRLYVDEWEDELRVVDIALLPAFCGQGIGSRFLKDVMAKAASIGKCVSVHVEQHNPARHLYERLGFREVDERGVYVLMEWQAASH